ncbi:MAG: DEAD/DEAH box helicase [Actinomycetota bacterium]|nr:DEAD/DEAH box helicase [Actinomycetota bacterium]
MTTFIEIGVGNHISNRLSENNIQEPTAIQSIVIPDALEGKDVLAMAGTGSGKTLAFLIPVLQGVTRCAPYRPSALILVPTRELALQVKDVFLSLLSQPRNGQPRIAAIYGGSPIDRQMRDLSRGVEVVVATPGRLIDLMDRRAIDLSAVTTVVIDEADRMADMGFLPPVEEILTAISSQHQTMLFSATLDGDVRKIINNYMNSPVLHEIKSDDRSLDHMLHYFLMTNDYDKLAVVRRITSTARKAIIFVRTRDNADRLADELNGEGVRVDALHGNMRQSARERVLNKFSKGATSILVATDVAARGIDVAGLDLVVHYELPDDHKSYIHRSGRTARAGTSGAVVTLLRRSQMRVVNGLQRELGLKQQIFMGNPEEKSLGNIAVLEKFEGEEVEFTDSRQSNSGGRRSGGGFGGYRSYRPSGSGGSYRDREFRGGGSSYQGSSNSYGRSRDASGNRNDDQERYGEPNGNREGGFQRREQRYGTPRRRNG